MDKMTLARQIHHASNIKGQFVLRSGKTSNEYFDKYLFESNPPLLLEIAKQMKDLIPPETDFLGGLEMGGIPIAVMISQIVGLPTLFVRKKAKEYGTCKLAEGGDIHGKRILIVEDVVSTGGAIVEAVTELRNLGAEINRAVCVIDRETGGKENLRTIGIELVGLLKKSELEIAIK